MQIDKRGILSFAAARYCANARRRRCFARGLGPAMPASGQCFFATGRVIPHRGRPSADG
jgi:hypothetical protein